jgi:hypothetical protein
MTATITKLTGQALVDYVNKTEVSIQSKTEQCLGAGYVRDNGGPAFTDFYEALLDAKGVEYDGGTTDADWYDNMTEQAQTLYDQIEDMCPEFTKFTTEQCDDFMNELDDIGITTAQQFEDAYYMQFDSYNAEREFAEYVAMEVNCVNIPDDIRKHIDWQSMWDCELCYDFFTIEFDGETYFFHNN